tara:strand:+ start:2105 stop:2809 length:705 start_codon:yes stop_codon:yes gene_type:complete
MALDWKDYQEEAAAFFRSLGLSAATDQTLHGVRTKHDIDVLVEIDVAGQPVKWIVECKYWKSNVSKLYVMALREIVNDLGADRGIILCETGFQRGAVEAANLTNVRVSSLAELRDTSRDAIASYRLNELFDRNMACRNQYWELPKDLRIQQGLRPGFGDEMHYSGARVVEFSEKLLGLAFRGAYPIIIDEYDSLLVGRSVPDSVQNTDEVLTLLEQLIAELEVKLSTAYTLWRA